MMNFVINGMMNVIGRSIGYTLLTFIITMSSKEGLNIKLLILNLLIVNVGLLLLKINNKVL